MAFFFSNRRKYFIFWTEISFQSKLEFTQSNRLKIKFQGINRNKKTIQEIKPTSIFFSGPPPENPRMFMTIKKQIEGNFMLFNLIEITTKGIRNMSNKAVTNNNIQPSLIGA
jgi:hypothetical protein